MARQKDKKDKKDKKIDLSEAIREPGPSLDVENDGSGEHLVRRQQPQGITILETQETKLSRALSQRHIQMIALAGAIVPSSSTSRDTG